MNTFRRGVLFAFAVIVSSAPARATGLPSFDGVMSTIQKAFERGCAAPKRTGISPKGQAAIEYEETERELLRVLARIHNERRARGPVDILPASPTEDDLVRDYLRKKLADLENSPHITPAAIRVMPSPRPHPVVDISLLKLKEGEDYQVDGCLDAPR